MISWERDEEGRLHSVRDLIQPLNYVGTTKNKDQLTAKPGDICIENGETFIRADTQWTPLDTTITDCCISVKDFKTALPKVCKCCGAPLKGWKCEYCGVEYG